MATAMDEQLPGHQRREQWLGMGGIGPEVHQQQACPVWYALTHVMERPGDRRQQRLQ
jgi:hypothetical protein